MQGGELHAALLQAVIIAALAALCAFLHRRHGKPYLRWWAIAWGLYLLRIGAISGFLVTRQPGWLYWHQVATGWTALALLYAALVFSQGTRWRPWYLLLMAFPPLWSHVAIYRLDHFLWAAGPAVLFLSLATLWTSWLFYRYRRTVASSGATVLAAAFLLWGLHHLDYPFLRARGAWVPWGYYLDILFALAVGTGILLLVLDERFLVILKRQVGTEMENADLYQRLEARNAELARLSARMVEQHEEERRRLSRELHDETAQVFSAVKMELGVLRDTVHPGEVGRLNQVLGLIDQGIRSIRNVTHDLRPSLLDDLGLLPALRSLVTDFSERSGIATSLSAPATLPPLSKEAELALFRALQEGLSNVARHAEAGTVEVAIAADDRQLLLRVRDDGQGPSRNGDDSPGRHMGLAGMRERIGALGGTVRFGASHTGGALLEVQLPVAEAEAR